MDLFYGETLEEQLKNLKKDIKKWALAKYKYDYGHKRVYVAYGEKNIIADNMLIVTPPLLTDDRAFDDKYCKKLKSVLNDYKLFKSFIDRPAGKRS